MTKDEINALRVGDRLHDDYGEFRIMAMAEGYVMMRRLGCTPFAAKLTDFMDRACFKGFGPLRVCPLKDEGSRNE